MRKTKQKRRKKEGSRAGLWSVTIIALVMIIVVGYRCIELYDKNLGYETREAELAEELQSEEKRQAEIQDIEDSVGSDEYTEEIARERLGLVYSDETIYREKP